MGYEDNNGDINIINSYDYLGINSTGFELFNEKHKKTKFHIKPKSAKEFLNENNLYIDEKLLGLPTRGAYSILKFKKLKKETTYFEDRLVEIIESLESNYILSVSILESGNEVLKSVDKILNNMNTENKKSNNINIILFVINIIIGLIMGTFI